MTDKTCLSYWFPKLIEAAIPVPRTEIVPTELELMRILDDPDQHPLPKGFSQEYTTFLNRLKAAAEAVGFPCFLRTGETSNKHRWKHTCFIPDADQIHRSVPELIEFSAMADMMGLATNVWAVREYLPVEPIAVLPRYGDMPLVPEARCFIEGGKVLCAHSYWPCDAIRDGLARVNMTDFDDTEMVNNAEADRLFDLCVNALNWNHIIDLAAKVAEAFKDDGYFSVDMIPARDKWWVIDMAEGEKSFHYEGCQKPRFQ
jgi:hypothetical protein